MSIMAVLAVVVILISLLCVPVLAFNENDLSEGLLDMPHSVGNGYNQYVQAYYLIRDNSTGYINTYLKLYYCFPDDAVVNVEIFSNSSNPDSSSNNRGIVISSDLPSYYIINRNSTISRGRRISDVFENLTVLGDRNFELHSVLLNLNDFGTVILDGSEQVFESNSDSGIIYPVDYYFNIIPHYVDGYRKHYNDSDRKIALPKNANHVNTYTNGKITYHQDSRFYGEYLYVPFIFEKPEQMNQWQFDDFLDNAVPTFYWENRDSNSGGTYQFYEKTGGFWNNFESQNKLTFERINNGFLLELSVGSYALINDIFFDIGFDYNDKNYMNNRWQFTTYEGIIDENNDGIDDRTQERDEDGNIISDGTGMPVITPSVGAIEGFEGFNSIINSIKVFFQGVWGILPPEINVLIISSITIMIAIAVLKVVF